MINVGNVHRSGNSLKVNTNLSVLMQDDNAGVKNQRYSRLFRLFAGAMFVCLFIPQSHFCWRQVLFLRWQIT